MGISAWSGTSRSGCKNEERSARKPSAWAFTTSWCIEGRPEDGKSWFDCVKVLEGTLDVDVTDKEEGEESANEACRSG